MVSVTKLLVGIYNPDCYVEEPTTSQENYSIQRIATSKTVIKPKYTAILWKALKQRRGYPSIISSRSMDEDVGIMGIHLA